MFRLMDEISRNGSVLTRLRDSSLRKAKMVSQLEFDVNLVEREGRRLESDLNTVQSLHLMAGQDSPASSHPSNTSVDLNGSKPEDDSKTDTTKIKCVRFSESTEESSVVDTNTVNKSTVSTSTTTATSTISTNTALPPGPVLKPKSILKSESGDGDCSSDTGLSSLSVSSEEGSYSLTTLV